MPKPSTCLNKIVHPQNTNSKQDASIRLRRVSAAPKRVPVNYRAKGRTYIRLMGGQSGRANLIDRIDGSPLLGGDGLPYTCSELDKMIASKTVTRSFQLEASFSSELFFASCAKLSRSLEMVWIRPMRTPAERRANVESFIRRRTRKGGRRTFPRIP